MSWNNCSYLLPTIVYCEDPAHPLANREFLFPFASVLNVPQNQLTETLGTKPGGNGDYSRSETSSATGFLTKCRSTERGPGADKPGQLGSAARRQSLRTSVRAAGFPARCIFLTNLSHSTLH